MSTSAFTTVRTARTLAEADLLISALLAAGLHPVEMNTAGHFSVAGADIEYPVQVPTEECVAAKEVLASFDEAESGTETALIIRTDFSNEDAWQQIRAELESPEDPWIFNMKYWEEPRFNNATKEQILEGIPEGYPHSYVVVVDSQSISRTGHPLLIIDLVEQPGREFRAIASQVPSIDNNLSIGNMGFEEFATQVDGNGIFRGF